MIGRFFEFLKEREEGIAAVEFAVLAPVFFAVMSSVIEVTYFAYSTASVQRAVEDAVDNVRTGHVYKLMADNEWESEDFYRQTICAKVAIPGCLEDLHIRVQSFDRAFVMRRDSDETEVIDPGASGTLMRVEASIEIPKLFLTAVVLGDQAITTTAGLTFMTEPY